MIKFLHTADLHISENEKEYSLQVLAEIAIIAKEENVDAVLLAGDIFNDFTSMEKNKTALDVFKGIKVLYTSGNHEYLGLGKNSFPSFSSVDYFWEEDLSTITPIIIDKENSIVEIIPIPFQKSSTGWQRLDLPPKKALRIAMLHGSIPEILDFTGISEEDDDSLIDFTVLKANEIDILALGHIHAGREKTHAGIKCIYPGSPRVWRKGETGDKTITIIEVAENIALSRKRKLHSAGKYLEITIPFNFTIPSLETLPKVEKNDRVHFILKGYAESVKIITEFEQILRRNFELEIRQMEISTKDILILPDLMGNSTVKRFLHEWQNRKPDDPDKIDEWLYARDLFIETIREKIK